MIGTHFRHNTIRRYTAAFGSLFDGIIIARYVDGVSAKELPVPLFYSPGQKFIIKKNSDYGSTEEHKVKMTLPRIGFSMVGMQHNPQRQPNKNIELYSKYNSATQYNRVPYDFIYQLQIKVKNIEDGTQIIEQICPFFTPYLSISMIDNEDIGITSDIQINLDSVTPQDTYEGAMDEKRIITWDLNFTLQGWLYKPTTTKPLIKEVDITVGDYTRELMDIKAEVVPREAREDEEHSMVVEVNLR